MQATAQLRHPNTVEIYDYGIAEDGTFYYVMEYLPGLSLEDLIGRHGPQSADRVIHIARQVCGALREAHKYGLVHRDIKPSMPESQQDAVRAQGRARYAQFVAQLARHLQRGRTARLLPHLDTCIDIQI